MGKAWKRHTHHKRWLTKRGRAAEIGGVATRNWPATPATQEAPPAPEAPVVEEPVVEEPVKAAPKKTTRRSTKKSTK